MFRHSMLAPFCRNVDSARCWTLSGAAVWSDWRYFDQALLRFPWICWVSQYKCCRLSRWLNYRRLWDLFFRVVSSRLFRPRSSCCVNHSRIRSACEIALPLVTVAILFNVGSGNFVTPRRRRERCIELVQPSISANTDLGCANDEQRFPRT